MTHCLLVDCIAEGFLDLAQGLIDTGGGDQAAEERIDGVENTLQDLLAELQVQSASPIPDDRQLQRQLGTEEACRRGFLLVDVARCILREIDVERLLELSLRGRDLVLKFLNKEIPIPGGYQLEKVVCVSDEVCKVLAILICDLRHDVPPLLAERPCERAAGPRAAQRWG